jgi:Fe-S cluster biogenesis protein NfuA
MPGQDPSWKFTTCIIYLPAIYYQETRMEVYIMREKVEAALNEIRPGLQADGGDVELVDIEDGVVKVRLKGACAGCPMSQMTLAFGIERVLKERIPEVKKVEAVPL